VNGCSTMMFHQEGTNAVMSKKQSRGEPDKAAALDQDRHLDFIHGGHLSKNGLPVASGVFSHDEQFGSRRAAIHAEVELWFAT
jgi:hypothetical protein